MRTRSGVRSSRNSTTRQRGGTCSGTPASLSGAGSSGAVCCALASSARHAAARVTPCHGLVCFPGRGHACMAPGGQQEAETVRGVDFSLLGQLHSVPEIDAWK